MWGSRLWGTHNSESDYDFIVILKGHAGFKETKHFGGMVDVSLYDEKSWAEESEKKYAPAWTYYFPEEAKWKETRPPEKPDADGLKAAIGQRLKKGMKIMSKKIKTNNDLALRKFGHNLRMIELTRCNFRIFHSSIKHAQTKLSLYFFLSNHDFVFTFQLYCITTFTMVVDFS